MRLDERRAGGVVQHPGRRDPLFLWNAVDRIKIADHDVEGEEPLLEDERDLPVHTGTLSFTVPSSPVSP